MMNYAYDTSLQETMILTEAFHTDRVICDNGSLYKFIWVQEGKLTLIVDHVEIEMEQDEIISVSNLHRTEFKNVSGRYLALLFNENFYGIFKALERGRSELGGKTKRLHRFTSSLHLNLV